MPRPDRARRPNMEILLLVAAAAPWIGMLGGPLGVAIGALAVSGLLAAAVMLRGRERDRLEAGEEATRAIADLAAPPGRTPPPPPADQAEARRLAEAARVRIGGLESAAASMEAIVDALDEPVLALGPRGTVLMANRSAEAMLAQGSGVRATGQPLDQLLPDEHALEVVRAALQGQAARGQTKLLTVAGPRILEIGAEPIVADQSASGAPAVVVTLRDVTEQATAFQLKTDFVANASHELRTPLAAIRTAAETLAEMGDESPATRARLVSMIASNAERLEELSRDLLDLSSLESAETKSIMERIDAIELANDLRELFESACAQRRITVELRLDDRLRAIWTDGRLLRLVLRNLIDNAVKFAYEDTAVQVHGSVLGAAEGSRGTARFEVIDRGIGIPLAQQQRIFERFYQVDAARSGSPRRRGTGLGLAIVKHALRAIGGTIQVRSVWQQGTTMVVELPRCVESERLSA